eukprot:1056496-Pyramimonas_sp.AAC.1
MARPTNTNTPLGVANMIGSPHQGIFPPLRCAAGERRLGAQVPAAGDDVHAGRGRLEGGGRPRRLHRA